MLGRLIFFATQHVAKAGERLVRLKPSHPAPVGPRPAPLASDDIWARVTAPIAGSVTGLRRVHGFQKRAAAQVDAAEYVLRQLVTDLATVMPLPADTAPLRAILAEMAEVASQAPETAEPAAQPGAEKPAIAA